VRRFALPGMALRDEDVAPGATRTLVGSVKASGGFPATPFSERQGTLPSGLNFTTCGPSLSLQEFRELPLVGASLIGHPDVSVPVQIDLVGKNEEPPAKALHHVARGIELEDRRQRRPGAAVVRERGRSRRDLRIRPAPVRNPDGDAVAIDPDGVERSARSSLREISPGRDALVWIGQVIGRLDIALGVSAGAAERDCGDRGEHPQPCSLGVWH
jgi:hypothetical protein